MASLFIGRKAAFKTLILFALATPLSQYSGCYLEMDSSSDIENIMHKSSAFAPWFACSFLYREALREQFLSHRNRDGGREVVQVDAVREVDDRDDRNRDGDREAVQNGAVREVDDRVDDCKRYTSYLLFAVTIIITFSSVGHEVHCSESKLYSESDNIKEPKLYSESNNIKYECAALFWAAQFFLCCIKKNADEPLSRHTRLFFTTMADLVSAYFTHYARSCVKQDKKITYAPLVPLAMIAFRSIHIADNPVSRSGLIMFCLTLLFACCPFAADKSYVSAFSIGVVTFLLQSLIICCEAVQHNADQQYGVNRQNGRSLRGQNVAAAVV